MNEGSIPALDSILQRRRAPEKEGLRATQVAILSSLRESGNLPASNIIDDIAAESGKTGHEMLSALHEHDYVRMDKHGKISAAYPFSIRPTRHRVELKTGVAVFAMCAIDALGIPPMVDSDATIYSSTDSGDEICVTFRQQHVSWDPPEAVVLVGTESPTGAAADVCCQHMNFFASQTIAETWAKAHPEIEGAVLDQGRAVQLGAAIFGTLLRQEGS
ncbi:hypothetical protein LTR39_000488 [Cryomyces antarcticus]|nr:hypothetical protein LTR39_000488 [Cryomyces antarcticus]KAK5148865.1 hypothetical protein LTR04_000406 [Oleoguttula sp. CCFEE 6159]